QTLFANVFQLPPGHWLKLRVGDWSLRIERYFELKPQTLKEQKGSPQERLKELLSDAVSLRTISDVPIGTTLSGGLDSTSIACLLSGVDSARRFSAANGQQTFSIVYGDPRFDETASVDQIVDQIQAKHTFATLTPQDLLNDLDAFIWHQDEPFEKVGVF